MLKQPLMPRLPGIWPLGSQPRPEMLPHEWVRIQLVRRVMARFGKQAEIAQMASSFSQMTSKVVPPLAPPDAATRPSLSPFSRIR